MDHQFVPFCGQLYQSGRGQLALNGQILNERRWRGGKWAGGWEGGARIDPQSSLKAFSAAEGAYCVPSMAVVAGGLWVISLFLFL